MKTASPRVTHMVRAGDLVPTGTMLVIPDLDSSFNQTLFKSLTYLKDFLRSLNGESGRASHLMYKFDKQIVGFSMKCFCTTCEALYTTVRMAPQAAGFSEVGELTSSWHKNMNCYRATVVCLDAKGLWKPR